MENINYECELCKLNFQSAFDLEVHVDYFHMEPVIDLTEEYKCKFCSKEFQTFESLEIHESFHEDEENFELENAQNIFRV